MSDHKADVKTIHVWPADPEYVPSEVWEIVDKSDIDWIAYVPNELSDLYIPWLKVGSFGCCSIDEKKVDGGLIFEGHHA